MGSEAPAPVVRANLRSKSGSPSEGQQVAFTLELGAVRFEAGDVRP
ncbi:hypothetical protein OG730_00385 [Streptomyces sp. NBC_01298]|nr:hypothetical protein OG730_00385 [Streptomyces sp. NBC_01298]